MKIRMNRGSLRLRLSRSEVDQFGKTGKVEERVSFGPGPANEFSYCLDATPSKSIQAALADRRIEIHVPNEQASNWALSDDVGIEGRVRFDGENELKVLIEKDFVCLTGRRDEDQSDNFPHPKGSANC